MSRRASLYGNVSSRTMPLRKHHLIECVPNPNQYQPVFLSYQLKVDHRILAYLLGDETLDSRLDRAVTLQNPDLPSAPTSLNIEPIYQALPTGPLVYFQGPEGNWTPRYRRYAVQSTGSG